MAADQTLFDANLAKFLRHFPDIYEALKALKPQSTLITLPDGSHDVEFRGERLYGEGGDRRAADSLIENFSTQTKRMILSVNPERTGERFVDYFGRHAMTRLNDLGVAHDNALLWDESYHLVLFGVGLGTHLAPLLEKSKARSVVLLEPNLDFLWHSLWVTDWGPLLALRDADIQAVTLSTTVDPLDMANVARVHCRMGAPIAVDGVRVVRSYPGRPFDTAIGTFIRDGHLINIGLGFMEDEMEMVRASYHNFAKGDFKLYTQGRKMVGYPAFIVGSGPSLDDDIEFLKENRDRAIIFSCGSALGVLMKNGIKPDFQVQLENSEAPYKMLKGIADNFDLSGITLIGSTTISPNIRDLFDEVVFYIRSALASFAMFFMGDKHCLPEAGPTVTNTGMAVAMTTGFREIYYFGVDLGARVADRHHSVHSPYAMDGAEADYAKGNELQFEQAFGEVAVANFGGVVYTDAIMQWARDTHQKLLRAWRVATVYNCSDGIKIEGTVPKVSYSIALASKPEDKAAALQQIRDNWPLIDSAFELEKWRQKDWRAMVHQKLDALIAFSSAPLTHTEADDFDIILKSCRLLLVDPYRTPRFEEFFIRGSALLIVSVYDYLLKRIPADEAAAPARQALRDALTDSFQELRRNADWFFDNMHSITDQQALKDALEEFGHGR